MGKNSIWRKKWECFDRSGKIRNLSLFEPKVSGKVVAKEINFNLRDKMVWSLYEGCVGWDCLVITARSPGSQVNFEFSYCPRPKALNINSLLDIRWIKRRKRIRQELQFYCCFTICLTSSLQSFASPRPNQLPLKILKKDFVVILRCRVLLSYD